jgi:hypothetical protein
MTHVQYIDCEKWKKVIGISLWAGLTILLAVGVWFGYNGIMNPIPVPKEPSILEPVSQFSEHLNAYDYARNTNAVNQQTFFFSVFGTVVNSSVIWYMLNFRYKWIEIKCGTKPKDFFNSEFKEKKSDELGGFPE